MKYIKKAWILLVLIALTACGAKTWQEHYDLGMRYLSEGKYDKAILSFTAAIEIDPKNADAYIYMAEAYWEQNDYESAKTILQQGLEALDSDKLEKQLKATELNEKMQQDEEFAQIVTDLYDAFVNNDSEKFGDFLESEVDSETGKSNWDSVHNLVFDGDKFHAQDERLGLTFNGTRFFYGQCEESGRPNGKGFLGVRNATYPYGGMEYHWYEGEWEHGAIVGDAKIWRLNSKSWDPEISGPHGTCEIICTFGENEIMEKATFIRKIYGNGAWHQCTFHIANGKYIASEWQYEYGEHYSKPCELHSDCGITFGASEFGSEMYWNPFSFVRNERTDFGRLYGGKNLGIGGLNL